MRFTPNISKINVPYIPSSASTAAGKLLQPIEFEPHVPAPKIYNVYLGAHCVESFTYRNPLREKRDPLFRFTLRDESKIAPRAYFESTLERTKTKPQTLPAYYIIPLYSVSLRMNQPNNAATVRYIMRYIQRKCILVCESNFSPQHDVFYRMYIYYGKAISNQCLHFPTEWGVRKKVTFVTLLFKSNVAGR